jgi:hypothetical protein
MFLPGIKQAPFNGHVRALNRDEWPGPGGKESLLACPRSNRSKSLNPFDRHRRRGWAFLRFPTSLRMRYKPLQKKNSCDSDLKKALIRENVKPTLGIATLKLRIPPVSLGADGAFRSCAPGEEFVPWHFGS